MSANLPHSCVSRENLDAVASLAVAYAQIDWHDFVVVETVDFQVNEVGNLPPPTTPQEVGARVLAQERYEQMTPGVSYKDISPMY